MGRDSTQIEDTVKYAIILCRGLRMSCAKRVRLKNGKSPLPFKRRHYPLPSKVCFALRLRVSFRILYTVGPSPNSREGCNWIGRNWVREDGSLRSANPAGFAGDTNTALCSGSHANSVGSYDVHWACPGRTGMTSYLCHV